MTEGVLSSQMHVCEAAFLLPSQIALSSSKSVAAFYLE